MRTRHVLIAAGALTTAFTGAFYSPRHEMTRATLDAQGYTQIQTSAHIPLPFDRFACTPNSNGIFPTRFTAVDSQGLKRDGLVCFDRAYKTGIADINSQGVHYMVRAVRPAGS